MLTKKTIKRINSRPRSTGPAPYVAALAAVVAALAVGYYIHFVVAAAVLAAGAAAGFLLYRRRARERTIRLEYDLDERLATRFARIGEACKVLSGSEEIRFEARQHPPKRAEKEERPRIEAGLLQTPGIQANVEVWGFGLPQRKLLFFPECALLYEDDRYRPLAYETIKVDFSPHPVNQEGEPPSDADALGFTWQHLRADGTPDKRYRNNPRLTQVVYGLLKISDSNGFEMRIRVSNRNAAMRFARILGSEFLPKETRANGPNRVGQKERINPEIAYGILGLEPGASRTAVVSAYRKLAKINHPDLVQHLSPNHREDAERRMRLLNAAYAELKHLPG